MRIAAIVVLGVGLSACASVQVKYDKPAGFNENAVSEQASRGLGFYTLQKIHVSVEPQTNAPAQADVGRAGAGTEGATNTGASQQGAGQQGGNQSGTGTRQGTHEAARTAQAQGQSQNQAQGQAAGQAPKGVATTGAETPAAKPKADAPASDEAKADPTDPRTASAPVAIIDGKTWAAKLTTKPDTAHGFLMGGVHGFWKKTSITASRLANTEQAQVVTVKAENLTAKRLGQVATVLGYFISPKASGVTGTHEAAGAPPPPLQPFAFDVESTTFGVKHDLEGAWNWTLEGQPDLAGVVSFETFINTASAKGKKVNYFPVPACITAQLVVREGDKVRAEFPLIVATANRLRLQPLPLDGKLTLSAICSATVEGDTQGDRYDEAFSDLAALQAAYKQVKEGKPTEGGGQAGDGSGKDASGTKKPGSEVAAPVTPKT